MVEQYIRDVDVINRLDVAQRLTDLWDIRCVNKKPNHPYNMAVRDLVTGSFIGVMMIKCRTCRRYAYPTYYYSKERMDKIIRIAEEKGVDPIFIVRYAGSKPGRFWTGYFNMAEAIKDPRVQVTIDGRRDRPGDSKAKEPVYNILPDQIKKVRKGNSPWLK